MDYEKEYYEIVRRARELHESGNELTKKQMEIVCPQLAESEDERIRKGMIDEIKAILRGEDIEFPPQDVLESRVAYLEKQRESTWTVEDDIFERNILPRILNPSRWTLEQNNADKHHLEEFVDRQKNKSFEKQKEQKPTEWSEEDEKILESIVIYGALDDEQITWLKSLRPQPHWKPSEEQMEALSDAYVEASTFKMGNILESLYNDLKKL